MDRAEIATKLKSLIVERLDVPVTADEISDDQPLFGSEAESLGLDSVEALEIAVVIESVFEVRIEEEEAFEHFYSVATLSAYVEKLQQESVSFDSTQAT